LFINDPKPITTARTAGTIGRKGTIGAGGQLTLPFIGKLTPTKTAIGVALALAWKGLSLYEEGLGTKGIGIRDIGEEAGGYVSMVMGDMRRAGDKEGLAEAEALWEVVKTETDNISGMPLAIGALENVKLYQRIVDEGIEIYKRHSYLKSKQQLFALEEEERKRQAAFWLEYRKQVLQLQTSGSTGGGGGRSSLNFGLL